MSQWMRAVSPPCNQILTPLFKIYFYRKIYLYFRRSNGAFFFPFFEKSETRPAHVRAAIRPNMPEHHQKDGINGRKNALYRRGAATRRAGLPLGFGMRWRRNRRQFRATAR
jgi:hypothetical protein